MQDIPWHPVLVHIPIGLSVIVPLVALTVTVALRYGMATRRTWFVVLALHVLLFAGAFAAMRTGHKEEDRVEDIVGKKRVHEHEERGEQLVWASGITAALSGGVILLGPGATVGAAAATTCASFVTFALAYRAGHSGGELVYKYGAASAYAQPAAGGEEHRAGTSGEGGEEDED